MAEEEQDCDNPSSWSSKVAVPEGSGESYSTEENRRILEEASFWLSLDDEEALSLQWSDLVGTSNPSRSQRGNRNPQGITQCASQRRPSSSMESQVASDSSQRQETGHSSTFSAMESNQQDSVVVHDPESISRDSSKIMMLTVEPSVYLSVHLKTEDDNHYPFSLARKTRTKPNSSICVWCLARRLLEQPRRPFLRTKISGQDADWEGWIRETQNPIGGNQSQFWNFLPNHICPMSSLLQVDPNLDMDVFFKDLGAAVLEQILRELRTRQIPDRDLMAQVRSAKSHKAKRIAGIIASAYGLEFGKE